MTIYLHGAERAFGPEIADHLAADGNVVTLDAGIGGEPAAHVIVVNRPVALPDLYFDAIGDDAFAQAVEDSLLSVFDIVQPAIPHLGRGSSIVVVASRAHLGGWGGAHVTAAGAALIGFCRTLALELAEQGVTVNVVAPDYVQAYADDADGRAQVAQAVAWFASYAARGVSGEVTLLNAGRSLQMREGRRR
jgi:NAD(P)-dependent dehydrogenase (short-subunit alcohol dehydrogenase family)